MRAVVVLNHKLTEDQEFDLSKNWHVDNIVYLPDDLQALWKQVEIGKEEETTQSIYNWLKKNLYSGDYLIIQGHFGCTFTIVYQCIKNGVRTLYACSQRESVECSLPDGSVEKKSIFKHKCFKEYCQFI